MVGMALPGPELSWDLRVIDPPVAGLGIASARHQAIFVFCLDAWDVDVGVPFHGLSWCLLLVFFLGCFEPQLPREAGRGSLPGADGYASVPQRCGETRPTAPFCV